MSKVANPFGSYNLSPKINHSDSARPSWIAREQDPTRITTTASHTTTTRQH